MAIPSRASERPEPDLPSLKRFEIRRQVGQGGAGLVFEAVDRERGTRVALKMLRGLDGDALLRFKDEFRALQDLEHPNVIRLGELYQEGEHWFFTMELIDGETFLSHASGSGDRTFTQTALPVFRGVDVVAEPSVEAPSSSAPLLDEPRLRDSLTQLARGLVAIHSVGMLHRDIKPSNVLVALDGRVVILDFGLVTAADGENDGLIVGTVKYMAPEQAAGEELTPKSDWYAVGVILYECLTGRPPFDGPGFSALDQKLTEDPVRPRDLVPDLPADLEQLCVDLLNREPEGRPDGAEVLRRLTQRAPSLLPPARAFVSAQSQFVGRDREFADLVRAFSSVRSGGTWTVILEGESGVGKTALVRRFVRRLPTVCEDVVVLAGRCYEREDVPYKAIDGVMDAVSRYLGKLDDALVSPLLPAQTWVLCQVFPVLARIPAVAARAAKPEGGDVQESRAQLFLSLREFFTKLGRRHPLVLLIDDLQWADVDSFALLRDLVRAPLAPALLLVATARPPAVPHASSPYGLPGQVELLKLERLSESESVELATRLLGEQGAPETAVAVAIAKEAQGHPLFIDELVRHARIAGGGALSNVHLDDALYGRVCRLDPPARALIEMLAVAGVALSQDLLRDALGMDHGEFQKQVTAARGAHLVRTAGWRGEDAIETYHNRVRESVTARIEDETRRRCHRQLAMAYERDGGSDHEPLFSHWLGAGENEKAGEYALKAADAASSAFAFEHAARFYERALNLLPSGSSRVDAGEATREAISMRFADALANAGYGRKAAKVFQELAVTAKGASAVSLWSRSGEELLACGALDEGHDAMARALSAVGLTIPRNAFMALLGLLYCRAVLALRAHSFTLRKVPAADLLVHDVCFAAGRALATVDTIVGASLATRALLLATRLGEASRIAIDLSGAAMTLSAEKGMKCSQAAARLNGLALALAEEAADPATIGATKSSIAFAAFCQGRFARAVALSDEAQELLRRRAAGAFWYLRNSQIVGIWALSWMGELDELSARVEARVREAEQRGDLYASFVLSTGQPALAWLRSGDAEGARVRAMDVSRRWSHRGYHDQHYWSTLSLTRLDLYDGHGVAAEKRIADDWGRAQLSLMFQVQVIHTEALHLRASACLAAAAETRGSVRDSYLRWAARAARALGRSEQPYAPAFASAVRAGLAFAAGEQGKAARELRQAVFSFEECRMRLFAEVSRWQLGELIGGDAGGALVSQATAWMNKCGIERQDRMRAMLAPGFGRG